MIWLPPPAVFFAAFVALALSVPAVAWSLPQSGSGVAPAVRLEPRIQTARDCVRVVDGDTIVLDGGERMRLIGGRRNGYG